MKNKISGVKMENIKFETKDKPKDKLNMPKWKYDRMIELNHRNDLTDSEIYEYNQLNKEFNLSEGREWVYKTHQTRG